MDTKEPYRATRLWNEVIAAFQSGMPVKKHRRRIQTYHNCFTAAEAVTWLHCYLLNNPNFGSEVTRDQTVNLLRKFLKCHVIESVLLRSKKKDFCDDSYLYRFTQFSSQHSKPSALCLIQSPAFGARNRKIDDIKKDEVPKISTILQKENLPECHFVEKKLSSDELRLVWKKVTISRLEKVLPFSIVPDFLIEKDIDGLLIKHNVIRLSKSGVVSLMDKTDDIPHWVISAMKCLTNWPNASGSGSCLPNYPGFEKDVFKVVRDYFINPQVPLLTEPVTPLLLKVFCHFLHDQLKGTIGPNCTPASSSFNHSAHSSSAVKTSTPLCNNTSVSSSSDAVLHHKTIEGKLLLDDPEVMWEYPSVVYFETDFATSNPITRVVSGQYTPRSSSYTSSIASIDSVSTISVCSRGQKSVSTISLCSQGQSSDRSVDRYSNYKKSVSSVNVYSKSKIEDAFNVSVAKAKSPLKPWSSNLYLQDEVKDHTGCSQSQSMFPQLRNAGSVMDQPLCQYPSEDNFYAYEINDLNTSDLSSKTITEEDEVSCIEDHKVNHQSLPHSSSLMSLKCISSPVEQVSNKSVDQKRTATYALGYYPEELKLAFQIILLLLPSPNRRQLHLLLRLVSKIVKNRKFILNVKIPMQDYLLETFLPAIVKSDEKGNFLLPLAFFLLDNCESLFQPPTGLKDEIEEYSRSCFGRISYSVDETCFLTYCELVSKQQYEDQKITMSTYALKTLLNSIIHDRNISEKEKKRKLKQFKICHPDVYYLRFPEKQEQAYKPTLLNRLVNLRM